MQVREFTDGCEVAQALLVRDVELRQRRDGSDYLRLLVGDRTGSVPAMVWEDVDRARECCLPGEVVYVSGRFCVHQRYGPQLAVQHMRAAAEREYTRDALLDGPARTPDQMEAELRALVHTVQNPYLRRLLRIVFGEESQIWRRYRDAPAAKVYHQAYRHGLLEHSVIVAQAVSALSPIFPGIDRDLAVTGALLHDIGKLDAYELDGAAVTMADEGKLQGEIPLGYYRVRCAIETIEGFPEGLAQAVLHIILSHHGALEHGSPVVPCTREATLVHMVDNLGGRLGSFDRLEKQLPAGEQWSAYDKALGGGAFFAARTVEQQRVAA